MPTASHLLRTKLVARSFSKGSPAAQRSCQATRAVFRPNAKAFGYQLGRDMLRPNAKAFGYQLGRDMLKNLLRCQLLQQRHQALRELCTV